MDLRSLQWTVDELVNVVDGRTSIGLHTPDSCYEACIWHLSELKTIHQPLAARESARKKQLCPAVLGHMPTSIIHIDSTEYSTRRQQEAEVCSFPSAASRRLAQESSSVVLLYVQEFVAVDILDKVVASL